MPFLNWVNDAEARRASKNVEFHLLQQVGRYGDVEAAKQNIIVQGDNLVALKALLPFYRGKVKCIYIDPPYNTGSAFEHYDDNLEHSQWLSMMFPRLRLLRDFLTEDGSFWMTLDDTEVHYAKVILDEIFGRQNFIADITWQKNPTRENRSDIAVTHDHILVYAISREFFKKNRNLLPASDEQKDRFSNPDHDPRGPWASLPIHAKADANRRKEQFFTITTPGGRVLNPPPGRCWLYTRDRFDEMVADNRIWFGKDGMNAPRVKKFWSEVSQGLVPTSIWSCKEVGSNGDAKSEQKALLEGKSLFSTPKPEGVIQRILTIASNPGDLVLDSFLGSGTTAAVAHKMGRHYIGIEMGEHAVTHCVPRLEKVIAGEEGGISKAVGWQGGGGFTFYKLGEPVFDALGNINPDVDFQTLAAYIWQKETGEPSLLEKQPFLGSTENGTGIYLLFNGVLGDNRPESGNILTRSLLNSLVKKYPHDGPKIVYADACIGISERELAMKHIVFKQIPYNVQY